METKSIIRFRGEPFMAVVRGKSTVPIKCIPAVRDGENSCGAGIIFEDGKGLFWGLVHPRDLITAWRATEILKHLNFIDPNFTLCAAYTAGLRKISDDDRKRYLEPIIAKIGRETHTKIMAMPIPEEIIRAILDNQGHDPAPSLFPIEYEVEAGTIKWQKAFTYVGIRHPDEVKAEQRADNETISKFEKLLISFARSRNLSRDCFGIYAVEGALLTLVKKRADRSLSKLMLVALAGVESQLAMSGFSMMAVVDGSRSAEEEASCFNWQKEDAISHSAEWLTNSILGKPGFFRKRLHLTTAAEFEKMMRELLTRLLEEYFPSEPAAKTPVPA